MILSFDLGSNTLRGILFAHGDKVYERDIVVRTAEGLHHTQKISTQALERIIHAIKSILAEVGNYESVVAVATASFRLATNAHAILEAIKEQTAICFRVILAKEEAELVYEAIRYRLEKLQYASNSLLVLDSGGASTEFIYAHNEQVVWQSFDIGILTTRDRYANEEEVIANLETILLDFKRFQGNNAKLFVSNGVATTIGAIKLNMDFAHYDSKKVNGVTIDKEDIALALKRLKPLTLAQRDEIVGEGRGYVIVVAIEIFAYVLELFGQTQCVVIDDGVAEGEAIRFLKEGEIL